LENLKGIDSVEDLGIAGRIIFRMDLKEIGWEGADWILLGQDREWLQALVNTIMNLQVLQNAAVS
jgi:hypothetical protein